jgi:hypothetical protein
MLQKIDPVAALPFVRPTKAKRKGALARDYWAVEASRRPGDEADDHQRGQVYARQALDAADTAASAFEKDLIPLIIHAMVKKGRFGWVEHGFVAELAERAQRPPPVTDTPLARVRHRRTNDRADEAFLKHEGLVGAALILARGDGFGEPEPLPSHPAAAAALREVIEVLAESQRDLRRALGG